MAYTLETILAEKYETIIRRGTGNTRARDFYDLYLLSRMYADKIDREKLREAIEATSRKRNSVVDLKDAIAIIEEIADSDAMKNLWKRYRKENSYAKDIVFQNIIDSVRRFQQDNE